jgi:serine/threonine-protein kinase
VTDHDEELLGELLLEWEELYERGQDTAPGELCKGCPLLADELASRIAALKRTMWLKNPEPPPESPTDPLPQLSGKVLGGRYRLEELIATGGFSEVWRAFDTELLRIVALKLPRRSRLSSTASFIAEARRVARLKHPSIVPVHDVGTQDDRCFIVTEYVEGGSLAQRLSRHPPSTEQSIGWIKDIAHALEYAHVHGVIHRDIKPANILIDHHGRALLADFGIAQSALKTGAFAPSLGTLSYMSPEQLEGKPATPQSDVYSLGVVLHECLTGKLPYSSHNPTILRNEILGGAKRVSPGIPKPILEICKKAMSRQLQDRHLSAAHFAAELDRATGGTGRKIRSSPRGILLSALAVCLVLGSIAGGLWLLGDRGWSQKSNKPLVVVRSPDFPAQPTETAWRDKATPLPTIENSVGMRLVEIAPGESLMTAVRGGIVDVPVVSRVRITRPFLIGQTEVTVGEWQQVMGSTPGDVDQENLPVTNVSWHDAVAFCDTLSSLPEEKERGRRYRLPTDAEWEYACRAGTTTPIWFGHDHGLVEVYAWMRRNSAGRNHPVGLKPPNPWGLYDIRGNVHEWVSDWRADSWKPEPVDADGVVIDPQGPDHSPVGRRLVRGGSKLDNPDAFATETEPTNRSHNIGFRVVAVIEADDAGDSPPAQPAE